MVDTIRSLSALQALLADNTTGDISAQDVRDFLVTANWWGIRNQWGLPIVTPSADDILWQGSDLGSLTTVTVTGSQTITEHIGGLSVTYQDQAASDMNAVLKPHTFSVGDTFIVPTRPWIRNLENFAFQGLVFTNGTASTSTAAASIFYYQSTGQWGVFQGYHGTLTNMANSTSPVSINAGLNVAMMWLRLVYTASNSFTASYSPDGLNWLEAASLTPTLTPTHFGPCWSAWNASATDAIRNAHFGPIIQTA